MRIRSVLFDLDGTLVDSNEFHIIAWARAFYGNGLSVPRHAIREQIGKGADQLIPALLPLLDEQQRKSVADAHGAIFEKSFLHLVQPFPRAKELIARVARGGAKAIFASSSEQKQVDYYANLLDATPFLADTVSIDDVKRSKPAGDIFASALRKAGVAPKEALVIGDTPYNSIAAAKCGVDAVLLRSGGFADDVLQSSRPLAVYTDAANLFECWHQSPLAQLETR